MNLQNKTVIVTGAARGIGAAMSRRFAAEGASVVVADLEKSAAEKIAADCNGIGIACDVTREEDVISLVTQTEDRFGAVDMFCSNAGVCFGEPGHAASATNDTWNQCWDVHVMSHVYAARAVLPGMIARGDGYLLQMSSAAGLLNQIGDAAYSTTKHAALGFAESLAITHCDDGIKVSVICPQYVSTPMLGYADGETAADVPGVITVEEVADAVVQGITQERFLILPHADVAQSVQFKSTSYDKWLTAMRRLRRKIVNEIGSTDPVRMHRMI